MSVFVSVEDMDGEPLAAVFELERVFRRFAAVPGCFLRFVGEKADSSFNELQSPGLRDEIATLDASGYDELERAELERVRATITKFAGKNNAYIRFYGETSRAE